jgi:hypothetical protein
MCGWNRKRPPAAVATVTTAVRPLLTAMTMAEAVSFPTASVRALSQPGRSAARSLVVRWLAAVTRLSHVMAGRGLGDEVGFYLV